MKQLLTVAANRAFTEESVKKLVGFTSSDIICSMFLRVAIVCVLLITVTLVAQNMGVEEVPTTPSPVKPEWKLGFDLGNVVILETPELNPRGSEQSARSEAQRLSPNITSDFV